MQIAKQFLVKHRHIIMAILMASFLFGLTVALVIHYTKGSVKTGDLDFSIAENCLATAWEEQSKCLDNFVVNGIGNRTVLQILAELEIARTKSQDIENSCHPIAHAIGRYALVKHKNLGDAFQSCDFSCHSGCYHGVMERMFFTQEEIDKGQQHLTFDQMAERVPDICLPKNFANPSTSIIFQCLHGIGHAILYTLDYNLRDALAVCDKLPTQYDRSSCYGGVFMENVTAFAKHKRDIKSGDMLYPCNSVDNRYQYDCYLMQTSIMTELGASREQLAENCNAASESGKDACFISIGRDLSNYVRTGQSYLVKDICENSVGKFGKTDKCLAGAIYALIDNTWDGKYAFPFCDSLSANNVINCVQMAKQYYQSVYQPGWDKINSECIQLATQNPAACS